jgi:hypothetical protein
MSIVISDLTEQKFPNLIASLSLDCYENCLKIQYFSKNNNISLDGIPEGDVEEGDEDLLEIINTFDEYLNQIEMTNIHTVFLDCQQPTILKYLISKYLNLKQAIKRHAWGDEYYLFEPSNRIPTLV